MSTNGEVVFGDVPFDGRVILYILKGVNFPMPTSPFLKSSHSQMTADQTNYINYIKPLILAEELQFPHLLAVIDTKDEWFYQIHPERYVPALKDEDPATKERIIVFEGTACLQYLAERFDHSGFWKGRTAREKADVFSWTAYQTAGIGSVSLLSTPFGSGASLLRSPINKVLQRNTGCIFSKATQPARTQKSCPGQLQSS